MLPIGKADGYIDVTDSRARNPRLACALDRQPDLDYVMASAGWKHIINPLARVTRVSVETQAVGAAMREVVR
ncbi:MAG: hypothetical protein ABI386_11900 [Rhodanobacter sp.]